MHHRLGARRPVLVRAHRPLVGGEAELRRRAQGVPHQPRRRRRAARRRDHHCSSPPGRLQHPPHQPAAPSRRHRAPRCCSSARCCLFGGGHVEVGPVPRCTPGCPTPWPARRRCRRSSTPPPWSSPASTWSPASTRCSSTAFTIGTGNHQPASPSSAAHHRSFGAVLAFVQNDIKKVLAYSTISQLGYMVMAPRRRRLDRRRVPPLHPRLLQGLPVPRRRAR